MCGGFVGDTLASIDPGPAIGDIGESVDQFVNKELPGGWITVGALTGGGLALAYAPEVMAFAESMGVSPEIASATLDIPPIDATTGEVVSLSDLVGPTGIPDVSAADTAAEAYAKSQTGGLDFADLVKDTPGFTTNADGNIVQTFDDGSTITLDSSGNPISSTNAPADPINWKDALNNPVTKKIGSTLANKALNSLLAPATNALMGKTGFKPVGQGGLSFANQSNTKPSTGMELTPGLTATNPNYSLDIVSKVNPELYNVPTNTALTAQQPQPQPFAAGGYAMGGEYQEHNPSFYSEGGMENRYVKGDGDGTSDDVAAMLANGEFVIPADVVAALGNGSNDAGAHVLDEFLSVVREDNHSNKPDELPPKSKGPLDYLAQARKRA
jgi:hypothetical protein